MLHSQVFGNQVDAESVRTLGEKALTSGTYPKPQSVMGLATNISGEDSTHHFLRDKGGHWHTSPAKANTQNFYRNTSHQ